MRILFTGATSFTGMWFACRLADAGHEVVATLRRRPEDYEEPVRRARAQRVAQTCRVVAGCEFGDPVFLDLVAGEGWDLLCHHAAEVTNYRRPDFDVSAALARNTRGVADVLRALKSHIGSAPTVLLTGSVFENDEGAGSDGLPAFSPYGLSKSFTYQVFRYQTTRLGLRLGKFVIPNPFGPYEEARFTTYLVKTWFARKVASVATPLYVRDNIHVSLLACVYVRFAEALPRRGPDSCRPSGYLESQGAFAHRFANEMRSRLGFECALELRKQSEFDEPRIRINTDAVEALAVGWSEEAAWDELAAYYRECAQAWEEGTALGQFG